MSSKDGEMRFLCCLHILTGETRAKALPQRMFT